MNRCSKCLLPETYPDIKFNNENTCNYCMEEPDNKKKESGAYQKKKNRLKYQMDKIIEKNRDRGKYDCLLFYSGGKDSTYLLYLLTKEYKLNVLAYTCDTGFLSEAAGRNIKKTIAKLKVDHIWGIPGDDFYQKLYSSLLIESSCYGTQSVEIVCSKCFLVMTIIAFKLAVEMKIPLMAIGFSPAQNLFSLKFKESKINMLKLLFQSRWNPNKLFNIPLDDKEIKYFKIPYKCAFRIPTILYPFSVLDYDINNNNKKIHEAGLIAPGDEHPLLSNCLVNLLMIDFDTRRFKYSPYDWEFSHLLRDGKLDRKEWSALANRFEKEMNNGTFEKDKINFVLNKLGLQMLEQAYYILTKKSC